jgi:hypothetical protein
MKINERIIEKLSEKFPSRQFYFNTEIDPISFKAKNVLSCDGKKTIYGYYPEVQQEDWAMNGTTLEEFSDSFVNQVKGIQYL